MGVLAVHDVVYASLDGPQPDDLPGPAESCNCKLQVCLADWFVPQAAWGYQRSRALSRGVPGQEASSAGGPETRSSWSEGIGAKGAPVGACPGHPEGCGYLEDPRSPWLDLSPQHDRPRLQRRPLLCKNLQMDLYPDP